MEDSGSYIEQNVNGNIQRDYLFTYSEEEKQQNEINRENAKLVFSPKFIPFYPELLKIGLTVTEAVIFGFIYFYKSSSSNRFYFTNEQLAEIVSCAEETVSRAISKFKSMGLMSVNHKIRAGGGSVRFVNSIFYSPDAKNFTSDTTKCSIPDTTNCSSQTCANVVGNKNKNNNNKNNIYTSIQNQESPSIQKIPEWTIELEFNKLWEKYPKRQKRKEAYRHFCKEYKKDNKIAEKILVSLNNYLKHIEANRTEAQYIMMGSTFFYNWSDWETPPSSAAPPKSAFQIELERLKGASNERDI